MTYFPRLNCNGPITFLFANNVPRHTSISFKRSHLLFSPEFQRNQDPNFVDVCFFWPEYRQTKKLRIVIFQFAVKILVRKAVGIRNLPEIRLQFKSEKQSALPTKHIHTHKATHTVLFSYKKKGFNVYRFVNRIEIMPPLIRWWWATFILFCTHC